ncbi:hypothetical protein T492DRAFT_332 [Pavlovales sp. CCMP2436]|nr:hypothetical protein T492DRAFT_332 [Pavlovales sp. CCMP2436]
MRLLVLALAGACAWQMLALRDLAARVSALEASATREALSVRAAPQPARFHSAAAGPASLALDPGPAAQADSSARRRLATVAVAKPRATVRIDVDNSAGVSDLVFGQDGTAGRVALEHDSTRFRLIRNTSVILEVEASGDAHVGSSAQTRVHGASLSFESRAAVRIQELDGTTPKWEPASVTVYVGDTVTWAWSSQQNVA